MECCKILKIRLEDFQENIISYKTRRGTVKITPPILPIQITPVFDMLLAHHIGDGTVIDPKRERQPYFGYRQFNKLYRVNYVRKLESVFGKINYKSQYFFTSTRPYCPASLSQVFFMYYNLNKFDFLSHSSRIPSKLLKKSRENQLAFLLAIIIDDGTIDSTTVVIRIKNKKLAQDLKSICDNLNYHTRYTESNTIGYQDYGNLYILKKGMKKLFNDYLKLFKQYPVTDLGYKGKQIIQNLQIDKRKIQRAPGNNDLILQLLSNNNYTINELAIIIKMTRQGVRYHINRLMDLDKIRIIGTRGANNYVYTAKVF